MIFTSGTTAEELWIFGVGWGDGGTALDGGLSNPLDGGLNKPLDGEFKPDLKGGLIIPVVCTNNGCGGWGVEGGFNTELWLLASIDCDVYACTICPLGDNNLGSGGVRLTAIKCDFIGGGIVEIGIGGLHIGCWLITGWCTLIEVVWVLSGGGEGAMTAVDFTIFVGAITDAVILGLTSPMGAELAIVITQGVLATFDIPGVTAYVVVVAGRMLFGVTANAGIVVLFLDAVIDATGIFSIRALFSGGSSDTDFLQLKKKKKIYENNMFN